eukprot:c6350_g1_i2.p1 GENE.c6350_g1_i2~~c6350_g1_i2.p1  ORF type:complete len:999 (-),score=243.71 c6350_g1_i2:20-3016(-)
MATAAGTSVIVKWEVPASNGAPILRYDIYYGVLDSPELHRGYQGLMNRVSITNLLPFERYRFRVRALNEVGESEYSEAQATTGGNVPSQPLPPFVLDKTATAITVGWTGIVEAEGTFNVSTWVLEVANEPVNGTISPQIAYRGQDTQFVMQGLLANHIYWFRVSGINVVGPSVPSEWVSLSPDNSTASPDTPKDLDVKSVSRDSLVLFWKQQDEDNFLPVLEYVLEQSGPAPWDASIDGEKQGVVLPLVELDKRMDRIAFTEYNQTRQWTEVFRGENTVTKVRNLRPGHSYAFRVRAVNAVGESIPCTPLVFHTSASAPIVTAPPTLVAKSATELRVEWDRPSDGGSNVLEYAISVDGNDTVLPGTTRFFVAKGLLPGSDHTFVLSAKNSIGSTKSASVVYQTLPGAPFKPPPPIVTNGPLNSKSNPTLNIRWSMVTPAGSPVTGYTLEVRDPVTNIYSVVVANELVFEATLDNAILPAVQYAFRLFAHSADSGVSEPSEPAVLLSTTVIPVKMPQPRVQGITASSILFVWDDLTAGENDFEFRAGASANDITTVYKGLVPRYQMVGLAPNTTVIAQLRAVNGKGAGPWSNELVLRTETLCVGDDGSVCSGRGACVDGVCQCYQRYTGTRCQYQYYRNLCAAWAAGHHTTFDGITYTSLASGEHIAYSPSVTDGDPNGLADEMPVVVHWNLRPLEFQTPNLTSIDSVAIRVGDQVLTLSTHRRPMRAANNVYVRLNCQPSIAMAIRQTFDQGMDIPNSPYHVRVDAAKRFIVTVAGSAIRVIVQPWLYLDRTFLNVIVVDTKPRASTMRGVCGPMSPRAPDTPKLESIIGSLASRLVSPTWFDQWLVPTANGMTQCPEELDPAFDTSKPVVAPAGEPSPANDLSAADMGILNALEISNEASTTPVIGACASKQQLADARAMCELVKSDHVILDACVWDSCALGVKDYLMAAHSNAKRAIAAANDAIVSEENMEDEREQKAAEDGTLTYDQQPLPVCPQ